MNTPVSYAPKQSLGQNFLKDQNTTRNIVKALNFTSSDIVLEIGPGYGVLTEHVLPLVKQLYAVEIDKRLYEQLKIKFDSLEKFIIIHDDFLKINLEEIAPDSTIRIYGNIPYHITSQIMFKVFERTRKTIDLTMLIQKEVALRTVAKPNTKDYGILAIISQIFADVDIHFHVPNTVFYPKPKVDSSLVTWKFTDKRINKIHDLQIFKTILKTAFGQRRKMLRKSLKDFLIDDNQAHFDLSRRPEQLTTDEWIDFANSFAK